MKELNLIAPINGEFIAQALDATYAVHNTADIILEGEKDPFKTEWIEKATFEETSNIE